MNARSPPRRSLATAADRPVTFPVNAPRVATATTAAVVVKNATSVDRLVTSRVTAPRAVTTAPDTAVASVVVLAALAVVSKHATRAVVSATWPVTAPRDRSATTVSI